MKRQCKTGKSCGSTCISQGKKCLVDLPQPTQKSVTRLRNFISEHGPHIVEHAGKGVIAWKTGKVLAPAVSGFLETHYGIPREVSGKMAETVIQAVTATALEYKHIKTAQEAMKKLLVETAAAYVGKTAHGGVERIVDAREIHSALGTAMPILAGKFSGITTAVAGGKVPSPSKLAELIISRSKQDTQKLFGMIMPQRLSFAEPGDEAIAELIGDIAVLALLLA